MASLDRLDQRVLIGSSVWIAYFDKDDSHAERAKKILNELTESSAILLLTDYMIQEIITVLLYKNKPKLAECFMEYLEDEPSAEILSIDASLLQKTMRFAKSKNWRPKLSLTDWSLFTLASTLNLTLYTFDGQLNHAVKKKR